jgi:hypothetical protein
MKRAPLNPEYGKRHVVLKVRDGTERHYVSGEWRNPLDKLPT